MNGLEKRQKESLLKKILKTTKEFSDKKRYELELEEFFEKEITKFLGINQKELKNLEKKRSIRTKSLELNIDILIVGDLNKCNYYNKSTYRSNNIVVPINNSLKYPVYNYGQSEDIILKLSKEKINEVIDKLSKLVEYMENCEKISEKLSKLSYQELKDLFPEVEEDTEDSNLILRALKNFQNRI